MVCDGYDGNCNTGGIGGSAAAAVLLPPGDTAQHASIISIITIIPVNPKP